MVIVRATVLALVALAACDDQPSMLDHMPSGRDARSADADTWRAIEKRALPILIGEDLLETAVAIPDRGSIDERAAALVAWLEAGGSVPDLTTMTTVSSSWFMRIPALVKARPDNDRLFEAGLYAAWKLRCEGTGFMGVLLANAITKQLAAIRDVAPAFAAKYAATDAQVFRAFASEAMYVRHGVLELGDPEYAVELAMWRELANAPTERAAFRAFVDRMIAAHPKARAAASLRSYEDKMFAGVDSYQQWLARGSAATPAQ